MSHDRLYWSCRRGMLELDLILVPFLQQQYERLSSEEQEQFQQLLACTDVELFAWLTQRETPTDTSLIPIITRIRDYANDPDRPRQI